MAPPDQIFLLLLMFLTPSLICYAAKAPWDTDSQFEVEELAPEKINKLKEGAKAAAMFILGVMDTVLLTTTPFLSLIEPSGKLIAAGVNLARLPLSILKQKKAEQELLMTVVSQFQNLNQKLDNYRVEHKWDTWAASTFSKPERKIENAWKAYNTMFHAMRLSKTDTDRDKHRDEFINNYPKFEPATKDLHTMLMARGATFINPLGDLLGQQLWCHQRDIREYSAFITELIFKGNMMNQFYYKIKEIDSRARVEEEAKIAYDAASVMFSVHVQCIKNGMYYVKKDVELLIDNAKQPKQRSQLAKQVREFLDKTYDSYNWMVVVFITKKSSHKIVETRNKHTLSRFIQVTKDKVSVAVARQVKGTHTKAVKVKEVIQRCVPQKTICYKVAETLSNCQSKVDFGSGSQVPVSETYTAIHAYSRIPEGSYTGEAESEDVSADPGEEAHMPQIFVGKCKKSHVEKKGEFVVLIKSDEEMMNKNPCDKLSCGTRERGSCVPLQDAFLAMCECKHPYYGRNCEKTLETYKIQLELQNQGIIVVRDLRRPRSG